MKKEINELDLPAEFKKLSAQECESLLNWIRARLVVAKTVYRTSSYGLKHQFEEAPDGFYVTNGAFKGAMIAAGFRPTDDGRNSLYRIKAAT